MKSKIATVVLLVVCVCMMIGAFLGLAVIMLTSVRLRQYSIISEESYRDAVGLFFLGVVAMIGGAYMSLVLFCELTSSTEETDATGRWVTPVAKD
jgi:hypothetical protein